MYGFTKRPNDENGYQVFDHQYFKRGRVWLMKKIIRKTHRTHPSKIIKNDRSLGKARVDNFLESDDEI